MCGCSPWTISGSGSGGGDGGGCDPRSRCCIHCGGLSEFPAVPRLLWHLLVDGRRYLPSPAVRQVDLEVCVGGTCFEFPSASAGSDNFLFEAFSLLISSRLPKLLAAGCWLLLACSLRFHVSNTTSLC